MWTQPKTSAFDRPADRQRDAADVAGHAHTVATRLAPFIPRLFATGDGRVWFLPGIQDKQTLTEDWPVTMHLPRPHLSPPGLFDRQMDDLDRFGADYPLLKILDANADGNEVWAQAVPVGYTQAVPLVLHDTGDAWFVMGGQLSLAQDEIDGAAPAPVNVVVASATFARQSGLIGLDFTMASPTSDTAIDATLGFRTPSASGGLVPVTEVFCPVWAVNAEQNRVINLGLQVPAQRHAKWINFRPSGPSATLLSA